MIHTRKLLRILRRHSPEMPQIALVPYQHDHNVRIRMVPHLLQPARHILVCLQLADVVHQQRADRTTIVRRRDGPVPLLPGRVPDLGLDRLRVNLDRACGKLDADGGLAVQVEFITREAAQQVGLADAGVADEDDYVLLIPLSHVHCV